MKNDALFCVGQKGFIEKDGKVLVLIDPKLGVDFPGGKIQEGEAKEGDRSSLVKSLQREILEETGLDVEVGQPFVTWYFEFSKEHRNYPKKVYLVGYKCKYLSGEVLISDEHSDYKWVDKNNYQDINDGSEYFRILEEYLNSK